MKNILIKFMPTLFVVGIAPVLMGPTVIKVHDVHEPITISDYTVKEDCNKYRRYYEISLSSEYKMFKSYNSYSGFENFWPLTIETELHEIKPRVNFINKATVLLTLNENEFNNLISSNSYIVYYPKNVFDNAWIRKLWDKRNSPYYQYFSLTSNVFLYSHLSTEGLYKYKDMCAAKVKKIEIEDERRRSEENKPSNRLKKFFNLD